MTKVVLTTREVAEAIRHSLSWFRVNRARLEAEHAFPAPVPGLGRRWLKDEVEAWLARPKGAGAEAAPPAIGSAAEQRLARRAASFRLVRG